MKIFLLFITLLAIAHGQGIYEVPFSGFPTYGTPSGTFQDDTERIMDVWTNLVRVAPSNYKTDYLSKIVSDNTASNVFNSASYPARAPLFWNLNLNRAARAHSYDISVNCNQNLQHTDCNGTDTWTRVGKFATSFSRSAGSAENFVNANQLSPYTFQCNLKKFYPMIAIGGFICEGFYSTTCKLEQCTADGTSDGHRASIMSSTNTQISTGNVWLGNYGITTQVFSSQSTPYSPSATPLIATGSHIWHDMANANSYRYIVFINAPFATINSVQLFVNGVAETLTYYAGVSTKQGAYQSTVKTFTASTCNSYYFVLNYNSTLKYTYPQTGQYKVTDGATCTTNWVSTSTPATATPSTLTPSTRVPSTIRPSTRTPSTLTPSTRVPSTIRPSTRTPSTLTPSTRVPSTIRPSTRTPSTLTPSTRVPSTIRPSTLTPSTRVPSTLTPSTITPTITPTVTPSPTSTVYNTNILNATYYNTTFRNAAFSNITIKNTTFTLCSFINTTFTNTSFSNSRISSSSFNNTIFYKTVLDGVTFNGISSPGTPSKRVVDEPNEEVEFVPHTARSGVESNVPQRSINDVNEEIVKLDVSQNRKMFHQNSRNKILKHFGL